MQHLMSSLTPSSPESSKWAATNVIPPSANRSHSARIAALAAACSGGKCLVCIWWFVGHSVLRSSSKNGGQDRDSTFYCASAKRSLRTASLVPGEEKRAPDDH